MEQETKKPRAVKAREKGKKQNRLVPEGHTKRSTVYPDDLWSDIEIICEHEPLKPSPTKYIVARMIEAVERDKKRLGIV